MAPVQGQSHVPLLNQMSGQQEWTARVDSRQANVVAQIKLAHQALLDPAGRDGPCQLVVMKRHHLQPTLLVKSTQNHASSNGIQVLSCKNNESCSTADHGPSTY